jgi:hypothetical protein
LPSSCYPTLLHTFNPNKTRTYFPCRYLSSDSHLIRAYGSVGMKYDRKLMSIEEKTGSYYFFIPQVIALTWKSFFLQLEEKYIFPGFMIVLICSILFTPTYHVAIYSHLQLFLGYYLQSSCKYLTLYHLPCSAIYFIFQVELSEFDGFSILSSTIVWDDSVSHTFEDAISLLESCFHKVRGSGTCWTRVKRTHTRP